MAPNDAMYASGRLWFVRGTTSLARPFNLTTLQVRAQATRVADLVKSSHPSAKSARTYRIRPSRAMTGSSSCSGRIATTTSTYGRVTWCARKFVRLTLNPGIDLMPLWSPDRKKRLQHDQGQRQRRTQDGQRFPMIASDEVPTPPIRLILNWKDRLRP